MKFLKSSAAFNDHIYLRVPDSDEKKLFLSLIPNVSEKTDAQKKEITDRIKQFPLLGKPNETRFRDLNCQLTNVLKVEHVFRELKSKDASDQKPIEGVQDLDFNFVKALQSLTASLICVLDKLESDSPTLGFSLTWQIECMVDVLKVRHIQKLCDIVTKISY